MEWYGELIYFLQIYFAKNISILFLVDLALLYLSFYIMKEVEQKAPYYD